MTTKKERKRRAIALSQQGFANKEIAEQLQVSPATISRYLKDAKTTNQPQEQQPANNQIFDAFEQDLQALVQYRDDVLAKLDCCTQADAATTEQYIATLFQSRPWLERVLSVVINAKQFQQWTSHLDADLVNKAHKLADTIRWLHPWLKAEIFKHRMSQRGEINPPSSATVQYYIDAQRNRPQIEEKLLSGQKPFSYVKWDLDRYVGEIDWKLQRCTEALEHFQNINPSLDPDALQNISDHVTSIQQRSESVLRILESLQDHQEGA